MIEKINLNFLKKFEKDNLKRLKEYNLEPIGFNNVFIPITSRIFIQLSVLEYYLQEDKPKLYKILALRRRYKSKLKSEDAVKAYLERMFVEYHVRKK